MNIIDSNSVSGVLNKGIVLREVYYMPPEIVEEVEMAQFVLGKRIPHGILALVNSGHFDMALYIKYYKEVLNKYGGRSFYNMRGFGDVSIIASLYMLLDIYDRKKREQLFDPSEKITVYTNDRQLIKAINTEFDRAKVSVDTGL
jgi:hypothetical protein